MRYIKLWDGIASEWRYSKSPKHGWVFINCLIEAWHADAREYKRGTFRTSYKELANQTGIGRTKLIELLKDLSTGVDAELRIVTNKGFTVGYTEITVINYDKYQGNTSQSPSNVQNMKSNVQNMNSNVQNMNSNVQELTSNVQELNTKEEEEKNREEDDKKRQGNSNFDVVSLSTDVESTAVGFSFEDLIELYPKVNTHKPETIGLFKELNDEEKKKCINFAKQLQRIWKQNGIQDKYQFMKSCHTFVEDKMFNGKPKDIFPREISTEVVNEYTKEELEWLEKNKNYKTPIERFREQQQKENI